MGGEGAAAAHAQQARCMAAEVDEADGRLKWVWVKIKAPGHRRVPFWVPMFDPLHDQLSGYHLDACGPEVGLSVHQVPVWLGQNGSMRQTGK